MIDIEKLTKEDIGRRVVFIFVNGEFAGNRYEGTIVSWDEYIYVKYDNSENEWNDHSKNEFNDTTGIGSRHEYLEFIGLPIPVKQLEIITRADLMDLD